MNYQMKVKLNPDDYNEFLTKLYLCSVTSVEHQINDITHNTFDRVINALTGACLLKSPEQLRPILEDIKKLNIDLCVLVRQLYKDDMNEMVDYIGDEAFTKCLADVLNMSDNKGFLFDGDAVDKIVSNVKVEEMHMNFNELITSFYEQAKGKGQSIVKELLDIIGSEDKDLEHALLEGNLYLEDIVNECKDEFKCLVKILNEQGKEEDEGFVSIELSGQEFRHYLHIEDKAQLVRLFKMLFCLGKNHGIDYNVGSNILNIRITIPREELDYLIKVYENIV